MRADITYAALLDETTIENTTEDSDVEKKDILFEIEENRGQSSKHYRLSDGSIMAADYGMNIHYEEDGKWKNIDNRFIYESSSEVDSMEGFATAEGNVEFKFAPDTGDGDIVRATISDYSVGFEFLVDAANIQEGLDASLVQMEDGISIENTDVEIKETDSIPITFIRGDILNESEAAQVLDSVEIQTEAISSYAANVVSIAEAENVEDEVAEVVWEDAGAEYNNGEEKSLMEQAARNCMSRQKDLRKN